MATKKTYPGPTEYSPIITMTYTAVLADESTDKHAFTMPRPVTCAIAQIRAATTGVVNSAGLATKITTVTGSTPSCTVEVAATALATGDVISLIAW